MRRLILSLLFVTSVPFVPSATALHPLTLISNGVARLPILAPSTNDPAALDLAAVLKKISGAEPAVLAAAPGTKGVYVGAATNFPWLGLEAEAAALGAEGCLVRSDGTNLVLLGRTPLGARHAAMTFLHELGCRWFFPGAAWEVLPELKTISGTWSLKQAPSFNIQRHLGYGFGAYGSNAADKRDWDLRNRMGGAFPVSIGHAGHGLSSNDFVRAPELFAMREGKRVFGSKPCFSHPDFIRRATDRVLAEAAEGAAMVSMTPADGLGYCECPLCRERAKGGAVVWTNGSQFAVRPDGKLVCITSESLFNCINSAARELKAKYPEALIGTYAYSAYSHPPSFPVESNVFIQTTTAYRRTPMTLQEQLETFHAMGVQSGIRAYWAVYQWDWDAPVVKGELELTKLADNIRFYYASNARSLNTEMSCNWGPRGLGYYVGSRLLWNVNEDPKSLVADFYQKAFGPAAAPMERYYVRWLGEGARVTGKPAAAAGAGADAAGPEDELGAVSLTNVVFSRETLKAACADLDEAARLVKDWPAGRARVDQLRMYAHYLVLRLRLEEAGKTKDKAAIVNAVKEETVFGARIMKTNMIHARPLIGKAFHRRFKAYALYLKGLPEWPDDPVKGWNKGFRAARSDVPAADELAQLWAADKAYLGF